MRRSLLFALLLILGFVEAANAVPSGDLRLKFKAGDLNRVVIIERLTMMQHFPNVDEESALPSIRTTRYSFTERIDSVLADGSAHIGMTLDSFSTVINLGEGKRAQEFFHFNSNDGYDVKSNFRDIKVLPRGQFLGQTLHMTIGADGTIRDFQDLENFHLAAVGKGYDYDMVHAMLALADTLRLGQLFEQGFGGLAALDGGGKYSSWFTVTEVPVRRSVTAQADGATVTLQASYSEPPKKIDYLEGIAYPMEVTEFKGKGSGLFTLTSGKISHAEYHDSTSMVLNIDIEKVPEDIFRTVSIDRSRIEVMHGGTVKIKETENHRAIPKVIDPSEGANIIDPKTGHVVETKGEKKPEKK